MDVCVPGGEAEQKRGRAGPTKTGGKKKVNCSGIQDHPRGGRRRGMKRVIDKSQP